MDFGLLFKQAYDAFPGCVGDAGRRPETECGWDRGGRKVDPAGSRETEFIGGAQGAESLPAWRLSPRFFEAPSRKLGNGVHDLGSRLPWVWRRGVRLSPFGAGVWLVSRPIVAASGSPAVVSGPWN